MSLPINVPQTHDIKKMPSHDIRSIVPDAEVHGASSEKCSRSSPTGPSHHRPQVGFTLPVPVPVD